MSFSNTSLNPENLNSDLLRTFLVVADTGSFSMAAETLFRSQSAISLQIKQLEGILGQPLFERHARGVHLSSTGERLFPSALQIVTLLDKTFAELKANPLQGKLRIGIPDELGKSLLTAVVAQFSRNHPAVELSVNCSLSANFPDALKNNELDLAVHAVETLTPEMHLLRREKLHWVTSRNHQVHTRNPIPVALFDRSCWWRDTTLAMLNKSGLAYQIVYSSESVTGISAAVKAGIAIGIIGESSMSKDMKVLSKKEGFVALPDSIVVIECRKGLDKTLSQTMIDAIKAAFN